MLDECPQLEVAQSMNLSVATMKSRVFRGKRILARTLSRRLGAQYCAMDMGGGRSMSCEM